MKNKVIQSPVGDKVPRRGNRFTEWLGAFVLWMAGWRVKGELPNVSKVVVIGAPHTSNWDAFYVIAAALALRVKVQIMAKDSLFKPPFKRFIQWLGGIPIDRSSRHGVVQQSVNALNNSEQMFLGLSPEGTRNNAPTWRSGFYAIAHEAQVPILVTVIDYSKKEIRFAGTFTPSGDFEQDLPKILALYKGAQGCRPALMSQPLKALSKTTQE